MPGLQTWTLFLFTLRIVSYLYTELSISQLVLAITSKVIVTVRIPDCAYTILTF
jgi:hypothetical protein